MAGDGGRAGGDEANRGKGPATHPPTMVGAAAAIVIMAVVWLVGLLEVKTAAMAVLFGVIFSKAASPPAEAVPAAPVVKDAAKKEEKQADKVADASSGAAASSEAEARKAREAAAKKEREAAAKKAREAEAKKAREATAREAAAAAAAKEAEVAETARLAAEKKSADAKRAREQAAAAAEAKRVADEAAAAKRAAEAEAAKKAAKSDAERQAAEAAAAAAEKKAAEDKAAADKEAAERAAAAEEAERAAEEERKAVAAAAAAAMAAAEKKKAELDAALKESSKPPEPAQPGITLDPSGMLSFQVRTLEDGGKDASLPLTISNPSSDMVLFKVKTTAPKKYCVKPNSGELGAGESATVRITPTPAAVLDDSKTRWKDKFLVQTVTQSAVADPAYWSKELVWKLPNIKKISTDYKIKCEWKPAADSVANTVQQEPQQQQASPPFQTSAPRRPPAPRVAPEPAGSAVPTAVTSTTAVKPTPPATQPSAAQRVPDAKCTVSPDAFLKFVLPEPGDAVQADVTSTLTIQNPSSAQAFFKVKTTAPKKFYVRPSIGAIAPGGAETVTVRINPEVTDPAGTDRAGKDKFLVQTVLAGTVDDAFWDKDKVWKAPNIHEVETQYKLKCDWTRPVPDGGHPAREADKPAPTKSAESQPAVVAPAPVPAPAPAESPKRPAPGGAVTLTPQSELAFEVLSADAPEVAAHLTLQNQTATAAMFKVKTTAPKKYRVAPSAAEIAPGSEHTVRVTLQKPYPSVADAARCRDKFLVQTVLQSAVDPSGWDKDAVWKVPNIKAAITETKLRCKIDVAADAAPAVAVAVEAAPAVTNVPAKPVEVAAAPVKKSPKRRLKASAD